MVGSARDTPRSRPSLVLGRAAFLVQGRDDPVVAVQDDDGDWQVTWTGDLIIDPIRWAPMPPGFDAPA